MQVPARNVIPFNPKTADNDLPVPLSRLASSVHHFDELRRYADRVAMDPLWSATDWRAVYSSLLIKLPGTNQSLADLDPIRVGQCADTGWAARVRTAHFEVENRLVALRFSLSMLTSMELSSPDAVVAASGDAARLTVALGELGTLIARVPGRRGQPNRPVTAMDDSGTLTPRSPQAHADAAVAQLAQQLSVLTDVLESVGDDPRLLDTSLVDVHQIVSRLSKAVKLQIRRPDSDASGPDRQLRNLFERARANENDTYEIYSGALELHLQRQRRDLSVADFDSDKSAIVKRRRSYIDTLFELCTQIKLIITL